MDAAEAAAAAALAAEDRDLRALLDTSALQHASDACAAARTAITAARAANDAALQALAKTLYLLDARQVKLVNELAGIYPILLLEVPYRSFCHCRCACVLSHGSAVALQVAVVGTLACVPPLHTIFSLSLSLSLSLSPPSL